MRNIPLTINLWEEFGVRRSFRRGMTTEALNAGIDGPTIDANTGWRKVEAAKGKILRYLMVCSSLSGFETSVDFLFGHLRETEGRLEFQYYGTGMLLIFSVLRAQDLRKEKARRYSVAQSNSLGPSLSSQAHPLGHQRSNTV
jgi:hypothetical protein